MYFTSATSRARFSQTVLYDMPLIDGILSLAERINDRMLAISSGRLWMAAHMRRGDCKLYVHSHSQEVTHRCSVERYGWAMEADFAAHLARIKRHLRTGRETLASMHGGTATVYNVPEAQPDPLLVTLDPPNPDDK